MKNLYIIAGCNGAGKTTASFTLLPDILHCREFINADEIARGLSPLNPEAVAVQAGKLMVKRFDELLNEGVDFSVETTLATKSYLRKIARAKAQDYRVTLLFFSLASPEIAQQRVAYRVKEGGHNIPSETILRRYKMGLSYLFDVYLSVVDKALIFDNSSNHPQLIAEQEKTLHIYQEDAYARLKNYAKT